MRSEINKEKMDCLLALSNELMKTYGNSVYDDQLKKDIGVVILKKIRSTAIELIVGSESLPFGCHYQPVIRTAAR